MIRTRGLVKDDPDTSWIEATFKAVEPVSYGTLRAQFIVYEDIGTLYPWTVRDVLPTESVTLSAAGDSVTVRREFVASASWNHANVWIATFIEKTVAPKLIVNAQNMRAPYGVEMAPESYAAEVAYFGTARFFVNIRNAGTMPDSIRFNITSEYPEEVGPYEWISLYCDPDNICWMQPNTYYFAPGEVKRFSVEIADYLGTVSGLGLATLSATSRSNPALTSSATFASFVNSPSILVVDDDGGVAYETHLEQAVTDNGYTPLIWSAAAKGRPPQVLLDNFWSVLWTTANASGSSITAADEAAMAAYLDGGGNLLLASMGYLSSRTGATPFTEDYLHIASWTNDTGGFTVTGVAGDPISDGMSLGLLGGPFPPSGSDSVVLESPADGIFSAAGAGLKALKVAENDHRVAFLSFPFEDVKTADGRPEQPDDASVPHPPLVRAGPHGRGRGFTVPRQALAGAELPEPVQPDDDARVHRAGGRRARDADHPQRERAGGPYAR